MPDEWPRVAVQLPIYNEMYVARRLIDAAAALDYPRDRLEIQVLDDSTDETVGVVDEAVGALAGAGHRHRARAPAAAARATRRARSPTAWS